ncbi:hypothetical protein GGTG_02410 [Gaeumannomyces tritici R3-111a-1]|uniref:Uncharacterized protein n=1 Tax=Gaeumannomyces tritici (strain R3-111a-1) TaxID=644352 RepID=J3NMA6_GAET3|nr:hypothetical protein GGTG_02410 [Gaeumannomyces tritici R3-111a-1]EJT82437.1 hypothetical protein GGTG_02410 [Gaeumannomyces tritici R3-111a-1]
MPSRGYKEVRRYHDNDYRQFRRYEVAEDRDARDYDDINQKQFRRYKDSDRRRFRRDEGAEDSHPPRYSDIYRKQSRQYDDTGSQFGEYYDPGSQRPGYYGYDENRWLDGQYPVYPRGRQWYDDSYTYRHPSSRAHRHSHNHRRHQYEYHDDVSDRGDQQQEGHDVYEEEEVQESRGRARSRPGRLVSRLKNWVSGSRGASKKRTDEVSQSSRASSSSRSGYGDSDHHHLTRGRSHSPDRRRGHRRYHLRHHSETRSRSRSRSRSLDDPAMRLRHAVIAGVTAGAIEAIRVRREPGPWSGPKGRRVATAAFSAAAIEAAIDKHPEHDPQKKAMAARIGGLMMSRIINGPRRGGDGGGRRG